jgi:hypothetical protein
VRIFDVSEKAHSSNAIRGAVAEFSGDSKFHAPEPCAQKRRVETLMKYFFALIFFLFAQIAAGQKPETIADTPEPGTTEAIAKATTEARFLSPWVSYVPASSKVPSPKKFFGRIMGAPGELANSEKSEAYFRALAENSPRVKFFTIGRSEEGRDIVMIAIADETAIKNLEQLKLRRRLDCIRLPRAHVCFSPEFSAVR